MTADAAVWKSISTHNFRGFFTVRYWWYRCQWIYKQSQLHIWIMKQLPPYLSRKFLLTALTIFFRWISTFENFFLLFKMVWKETSKKIIHEEQNTRTVKRVLYVIIHVCVNKIINSKTPFYLIIKMFKPTSESGKRSSEMSKWRGEDDRTEFLALIHCHLSG